MTTHNAAGSSRQETAMADGWMTGHIDCTEACEIPDGISLHDSPPARHAWSDVASCPNESCERWFLIRRDTPPPNQPTGDGDGWSDHRARPVAGCGTVTTLHDQVKAEVQRRLALAQAVGGTEWDSNLPTLYMDGRSAGVIRPATGGPYVVQGTFANGVPQFIVDHDPADAIRRHEAALRVLKRHQTADGNCRTCGRLIENWVYDSDAGQESLEREWIAQPWPCAEIRDLAGEYGIPIDDQEQP